MLNKMFIKMFNKMFNKMCNKMCNKMFNKQINSLIYKRHSLSKMLNQILLKNKIVYKKLK